MSKPTIEEMVEWVDGEIEAHLISDSRAIRSLESLRAIRSALLRLKELEERIDFGEEGK